MSTFEWPLMDEWEEEIRNKVRDEAAEYLLEYYNIQNVDELTKDQVSAIRNFIDNPDNKYSLMCQGLANIIMWLEDLE